MHMFCDANTPYALLRKPGTIIKRKADRHVASLLAMTDCYRWSGFALFAVEMNPAGASPSPTVDNIYPQSLGRVGWCHRISIFLDIIIADPPKPVYGAVGWL